jgi:hypothetical protein
MKGEIVYERVTIFKTYRVILSDKDTYRVYVLSHYDGDIQQMRDKHGPIVFYDRDAAIDFVNKLW